ncbi:NAD-dependent succinate-semialdehyde dehydrogenase [Flavihumibacter fluvii]|uniref:NAD-dependent succinate-semialdehyde dehydrogenase n=1 Tax=Flavihumibacter fluvii TaxID=2838157 RepID=UPI001BDEB6FC|nr:NAD-dependent succinate-semialdehyde dehydrogenase [Flavihumibacter fluvii]ULQ51450.1 NAD-dependent succinate-semialdehyde dehydrogenase [Flavihumibacter fluvii]
MSVFQSINPYSQALIQEYPLMDTGKINAALETAANGYHIWRRMRFAERAGVLLNAAKILRAGKEKYAQLITIEMGKVLPESLGEVEKCAWVCEYYAEHGETFLADEQIIAGYQKSFVTYEPIGAVLAIMPWNFPFWQVFRYAAPTLMAGNVTLLKHAPNVSGCSLAIAEIFKAAGAPEGVFQSIIIDVDAVEKILSTPIVQAVTLTGSERAGTSVAAIAGRHVKKSLLELGGSDALIVLPDADLQKAATVALQSRLLNAGQSCIGSKRFIVVKAVLDDFMQLLLNGISQYRQGDPMETGITTGPLARPDLAANLSAQLTGSIKSGAKLEYGGRFDGCNVMPSLLMNVQPGMAAFDQETFGPLAAVVAANDEQHAIELANLSPYGLGGSVWTKDIDKGISLARQITTGAVFINSLVKSDPRLPFGGVKKSGYGRELGRHGILEFVNAKTIAAEL